MSPLSIQLPKPAMIRPTRSREKSGRLRRRIASTVCQMYVSGLVPEAFSSDVAPSVPNSAINPASFPLRRVAARQAVPVHRVQVQVHHPPRHRRVRRAKVRRVHRVRARRRHLPHPVHRPAAAAVRVPVPLRPVPQAAVAAAIVRLSFLPGRITRWLTTRFTAPWKFSVPVSAKAADA